MDSFNRSLDYSFSVDSPIGLNQGFLLNPDNTIDSSMSNIVPNTPSPQLSKRRRSDREERLSPEAVSNSTTEELCLISKRKSRRSSKRRCLAAGCRKRNGGLTPVSPEESIFVSSPRVCTSPQESYLSAASSPSSSVVELEAQVVDSPVAIPSAANSSSPEAVRRRRWESLTMSAASLFPASLQADLAAVTEILDRSHARLEQELADEEFARYLQTQFDAEEASSLQQQRSYRYNRSLQHNRWQREYRNSGLGRSFRSLDPLENDYEALLQFEEQQGAVVIRKLNSREISRFPTKKFRSGACAGSPACNICLCDYVDGEMLRTLPCFHSYHRNCIDHWLKNKPICPVCRTDLTDSETLDTQHG